jgi:hypothetical protein
LGIPGKTIKTGENQSLTKWFFPVFCILLDEDSQFLVVSRSYKELQGVQGVQGVTRSSRSYKEFKEFKELQGVQDKCLNFRWVHFYHRLRRCHRFWGCAPAIAISQILF